MRYWAYLVAKLVVAGAFLNGLFMLIARVFPAETFMFASIRPDPFMHDLSYTLVTLLVCLLGAGLLWIIVWDQRYRCRTCLRRLRMPVATGSWDKPMFSGLPSTEYICPYGHGTLKVPELQITGHQNPDWEPHEDIWKELSSLEETKK
jgi:hypothetical protein